MLSRQLKRRGISNKARLNMKTSPKTQYVRIKPELPFKPWLLILPTLLVATVNDANALQVNIKNHWMRDYLDMAQNKGF